MERSKLQYTLVTIQKLILYKTNQMLYRLIKQNKLSSRCLLNKDDMDNIKDPCRASFWLRSSKTKK